MTLDEVPTFTEWREDDAGFLEGLRAGVKETVNLISQASKGAGDLGAHVKKIEDPERREDVFQTLRGLALSEGVAEGTEGFLDFGDKLMTNAGAWLLGKLGVGDQDRVADLRNYRTFVRSAVRQRQVQSDLDDIVDALGIQRTPESNPLQAAATGVSLLASPDMALGMVVPAGPLGRAASSALQRGARTANRLRQSESAVARVGGRVLDVASKAIQSPTGAAVRGAGAAVTGANRAASAAVQAIPSQMMGIGGGLGMAITTGNPFAALGGAYFFPAIAKARMVGSGTLGTAGDVLTGAGRILRAPTSAQALASANMAGTKGGRSVLSLAASQKIPARALMSVVGRTGAAADTALQAAVANGVLGYVAEGGNLERTGAEAGSGLVVGGGLGAALGAGGSLGQILGMDTPLQKRGRQAFTEEWLNSRPVGEQGLLRSSRLTDAQREMMAQASVIHGGVLSDGRADISERFVSGRDFARALVADGADGLPASMTFDEKVNYLEQSSLGGATYTVEGQPTVLVNMDAKLPARRYFHELGHALQGLQFRDPDFDVDGKAAKRFESKMRRRHGQDFRPEQMTDVEKAERNLLYGDPVNARRQQLGEAWFGENGRYRDQLPGLYEEYQRKLGRDVVSAAAFDSSRPGQVLQWDDLSPVQQRKASEAMFDEVLAEKTAMVMEGAEGGDLIRHIAKERKADAPGFLFGLDHLIDGYAGKLQRGLDSVGIGSDVLSGLSLSPEDRALIGGMIDAKRRSNEQAVSTSRRDQSTVRFDEMAEGLDALERNDPRLVERFASGVIDEGHWIRTGEVRPNTPEADRAFHGEQAAAVRSSLSELQSFDPRSLRFRPGSDKAMSGRYLGAEQLAQIQGIPDAQLPARVKHFLGLVNGDLLRHHHAANADLPNGAPLDLLYFSLREQGESEGGRRQIFPLTIEITGEGNLLTRALDMGHWERKAMREGAPKPYKDLEEFRSETLRHARGFAGASS